MKEEPVLQNPGTTVDDPDIKSEGAHGDVKPVLEGKKISIDPALDAQVDGGIPPAEYSFPGVGSIPVDLSGPYIPDDPDADPPIDKYVCLEWMKRHIFCPLPAHPSASRQHADESNRREGNARRRSRQRRRETRGTRRIRSSSGDLSSDSGRGRLKERGNSVRDPRSSKPLAGFLAQFRIPRVQPRQGPPDALARSERAVAGWSDDIPFPTGESRSAPRRGRKRQLPKSSTEEYHHTPNQSSSDAQEDGVAYYRGKRIRRVVAGSVASSHPDFACLEFEPERTIEFRVARPPPEVDVIILESDEEEHADGSSSDDEGSEEEGYMIEESDDESGCACDPEEEGEKGSDGVEDEHLSFQASQSGKSLADFFDQLVNESDEDEM